MNKDKQFENILKLYLIRNRIDRYNMTALERNKKLIIKISTCYNYTKIAKTNLNNTENLANKRHLSIRSGLMVTWNLFISFSVINYIIKKVQSIVYNIKKI